MTTRELPLSQAEFLVRVRDRRFPFSHTQSSLYLEALETSLDIIQLFQEMFPAEFQHAEQEYSCSALFPPDGQSYSPYEVQFFDLVNRLLFPLPVDDWLDGLEDVFGERRLAYEIPVHSMGFDPESDDFDILRLGCQLLLYLIGLVDESYLRACETLDIDDTVLALSIERRHVERALLTVRCEAQGGPIAAFHLAMQMLLNDTGSLYLDVTVDDPAQGYGWKKEDVETLHRNYQQAKDIWEHIVPFFEWLEENSSSRFRAVVRLWNACVRDSVPFDQRPKTAVVSASAFVEGIDFSTLFGRYLMLPGEWQRYHGLL